MHSRARIMIVDDNAVNVAILEEILSDARYDLASAASGEEALALAPEFRPSLVLLDIMMPGIDGYETCRRMRQHHALRHTKIIMVSAKAMLEERLQGYDAGADDYITKPFDDVELLAKVRVFLRLKTVEEVDQLKSDVLTLLSHETRTPLTAILAPVQMLMAQDDVGSIAQSELLNMIQHGANRLLHLFEQVVMLSQLKTGEWEFSLIEVNLSDVVQRAVEMTAPQAVERCVWVQQEIPQMAMARIDLEQMLWVITAILDNAIRFSPAGGNVTINLQCDAEGFQIAVTDYGDGILPDFLPRVFDEFAQADLAHHSHGLALSMAIARYVVQAHGGAIAVDSARGAGTTFRVRLPLPAAMADVEDTSSARWDALSVPGVQHTVR